MSELPERLLERIASGEALLVLGPGFGPPELSLDALLEQLAARQRPPLHGFEELNRAERLDIAAHALGRGALSEQLAVTLPSEEALRAAVQPHHARLLALPFGAALDVNVHAFSSAALFELATPPRLTYGPLFDGPLLVQPRGDLLTGPGVLTRKEESAWVKAYGPLVAHLRRLAQEEGCVLFGFDPREPSLRWIYEELLGAPGGLALSERCGALWRASWKARGLRFINGPLEALAERLTDAVRRRHAPTPNARARLLGIERATRQQVAEALAQIPEARFERTGASARGALSVFRGVERRRLPLPLEPLARLAELCAQIGIVEASEALGLATRARRLCVDPTPEAEAALARALARLDDPRAPAALERALRRAEAPLLRLDLIAWRARAAVLRAEALVEAGQARAAMEHVAGCLSRFGAELALGDREPGGEDEAHLIYYFNLRLGALMALAARLAARQGAVYRRQARRLLERAVALRDTAAAREALAALREGP